MFQFLKHPSHWKQFDYLGECILNEFFITASGKWFSFLWESSFSFIFFFETIIAIRVRTIFFTKSYFCWCKPFYSVYSDTVSNGSSFSVQWNRIFQRILHSGYWKRFFGQLQTFCVYSELFFSYSGHHSWI